MHDGPEGGRLLNGLWALRDGREPEWTGRHRHLLRFAADYVEHGAATFRPLIEGLARGRRLVVATCAEDPRNPMRGAAEVGQMSIQRLYADAVVDHLQDQDWFKASGVEGLLTRFVWDEGEDLPRLLEPLGRMDAVVLVHRVVYDGMAVVRHLQALGIESHDNPRFLAALAPHNAHVARKLGLKTTMPIIRELEVAVAAAAKAPDSLAARVAARARANLGALDRSSQEDLLPFSLEQLAVIATDDALPTLRGFLEAALMQQ